MDIGRAQLCGVRTLRVLLVTAVLFISGIAQPQEDRGGRSTEFVAALLADTRHSSIPEDRDLYAQLLGSWELRGTNYRVRGSPQKLMAKVEFARVLDGRAIQDIWSFQLDPTRPFDASNRRVGTTLRIYDPVEKVWTSTWFDPVTRGYTRLTAHRQGAGIEHIGVNADDVPMRWTFTSVTETTFAWRGEHSEDGGRTWRLDAEYVGRRTAAAKR